MLAIKFALQRVTGAVILHAIYYMSKQGIEFDYDERSPKSLVKSTITLSLRRWKELLFRKAFVHQSRKELEFVRAEGL